MIKKNLKEWEECLPHVEFAYNRAVHSTTELCPFEVVYGFKPITPLDLLPLPIHERVNMEASKRADFVKKIHVKTKELIEKKGKSNAARMNKKRKEMLFKHGDLVWVHFRKDRFPKLRKSKLKPRGAGPYKVLAKINDNAYSIDLPEDEFGVSNSFNVADLTPYDGEDLGASGSTPFEGGDDEDIPNSLLPPSLPTEDEPAVKLKYEEETSIARGGEEQLDVKLDKELDMKISHGRAREEREECARGEEEVQAGIDKLIPCQLAPSVGIRGDKELISMARSTSSTSSVASNTMDRGKLIETALVDFVPHPPSRVDAYAYLEEPMEITFGKFHFCVRKEGSHRLTIPDSSRSVTVDSDSSGSVSSFDSGDEEISSTILTKPASSGKLVKIFSNMSFGSYADSNISSDSDSVDTFDFIDQSTSIREVFTDLYDSVTNSDENQTSTYHQVYIIGVASRAEPETSEAFDDLGNPYVDPADLMRGCERLSFLDAYSGYNQIRLKEEDEVKTAFITPYGVFCYRTMPFGLKNTGATYQRMMQKCLATQIGKNAQVYIDDVVITTKKGSTLIDDLKETFDNLDKFCLKLNPTKCSFGVPAGELLGFLVSARGIEANPEKIQAIVTMRKPTKLKEIQQLTVRVAALSRFVARLGEKALPFYALIKQGE
ncbi:hypothetical protein QYE76_044389 [Lolium multiflorum]|uniref:Reverse transcriptase domain-containing protein n=1 Tax=Lolium multiflorum TaxID=4521 RepID=A0AAD8TJ74_LOLMU|nr:hypothetical protein QYE76_044389 [Lolium multiflorum]